MFTESRISTPEVETATDIVFGSLADQGMETMTDGGVEFVLCASALTAQM